LHGDDSTDPLVCHCLDRRESLLRPDPLQRTKTELVQRFLNWNEQSKGVAVVKIICGVLVTLGGVWLIYTAP
jgi:hypothetical protein